MSMGVMDPDQDTLLWFGGTLAISSGYLESGFGEGMGLDAGDLGCLIKLK